MELTRRTFLGGSAAMVVFVACGSSERGSPTAADIPDPDAFAVTRWRADPFSLGSYSYLAVGSSPDDRATLAEPVDDRVFFAGEATSVDYPATVRGAFESGERAAAQVGEAAESKVVVVGAGVAGLAAATDLRAAGHEVTVIEGRDRIGGRIWTDDSLGSPVDLGASWIQGVEGNPVTTLADDLGVDTVETDWDNTYAYLSDGRELSDDEWERAEAAVADHPLGNASDPVVRWLANINIEHEFAASVDDLDPEYDEGAAYRGGDVLFPGGYGQLVDAAAEGLDITTGEVVTRIEHGADGVVVVTDAGEHAADAVVVTLPLGVLQADAVRFDPPLPSEKTDAIARLGMGLLDKVALRFPEVFWDEDADLIGWVDPESRGRWGEWLNMVPVTGEPILVAFNAADYAEEVETLDDHDIVNEAMAVLRQIYGP